MFGDIRVGIRSERTTKDGKSSLFIYFRANKEKVKLALGISVHINLWDKKSQRVKGKSVYANDMNFIIADIKSNVHSVIKQIYALRLDTSKQNFLKYYKNQEVLVNFYEYFQQCKKKKWNDGVISYRTMVAYDDTYNKLHEFGQIKHFQDITVRNTEDFKAFLGVRCKLSINSVYKHMKNLRAVMNEAKKDKIPFDYPFDRVKIHKINPPRVFLIDQEIKGLKKLYEQEYFKKKGMKTTHNSLKIFLFCCHTGLRISDAKGLTRKNVVGREIHFVEQKKSKNKITLKIPLMDFAFAMIEKEMDYLFEQLGRNTVNIHLKIVQEAAGINKPLTCHVARHSFAGVFYKATKDILALQKVLGHTKIETTMIYAHMAQEDIIDGMKKLNKLL